MCVKQSRYLLILLQALAVGGLDDELRGKNVREFGTVTVSSTGGFLLSIIIVTARQEMSEDQLRDVDLLLLVNLDRNTIAIVVDADRVLLDIDCDLEGIHGGIPLLVVGGVDEDLVEDLVEARDVGDGAVDHLVVLKNPEGLGVLLDGSDVGVGTEEDVLQLRLLLVHFLNRLIPGSRPRRRCHVGGAAALERAFRGHGEFDR